MEGSQLNWIASFIWGIADDVLRDLYVRGKYRDVILPMTVLRRLDSRLEPSQPAVLEMKTSLDKAKIIHQDQALCRVLISGTGLSPRVRGNLRPDVPPRPDYRSIPACAGEPPSGYSMKDGLRVYPRVCGGTFGSSSFPSGWMGLSPRVRGNLASSFAPDPGGGSIPACAGEPIAASRPRFMRWVYPRVCGGTP